MAIQFFHLVQLFTFWLLIIHGNKKILGSYAVHHYIIYKSSYNVFSDLRCVSRIVFHNLGLDAPRSRFSLDLERCRSWSTVLCLETWNCSISMAKLQQFKFNLFAVGLFRKNSGWVSLYSLCLPFLECYNRSGHLRSHGYFHSECCAAVGSQLIAAPSALASTFF